MKTKNIILMKMARESLSGKWGLAIGAYAIIIAISFILGLLPKDSKAFSSAVSLIITGPFTLGYTIFSLAIARNQEVKFEEIFKGFNHFFKSLGLYLLIILFIILWSLLLIIPGIIAGLSYSMVFYILADNKDVGIMEAIDKSKAMMKGYKWKLFCLELRFIGWLILSILTIGIGFFWLIPYVQVSIAKFYEDIKNGDTKVTESMNLKSVSEPEYTSEAKI